MIGLRRRPGDIRGALLLAPLLATGALALGCGDRAGADRDTSRAIAALRPWVRAAFVPDDSAAAPSNTAVYLILQNPTPNPDALVGVETPVAQAAEMHTVDMDVGIMRMERVRSVAIPAAGEAVLEPGGYHIMLIGLHSPLAEGDTVPLRLRLRSGRAIDISAPVLQSAPERPSP